MSERRLVRGPAAVLGVLLLASSCGVPLQSSGEPIPQGALPPPIKVASAAAVPSPSSAPASTPAEVLVVPAQRLWFVGESGLVATDSALPAGAGAADILRALAAGPADDPAGLALRTVASDPITGESLVTTTATSIDPGSGVVSVEISPAFGALPSSEQILLLGQVVLSLSSAGAQAVSVVDSSGTPVAIPLPDGRLLDAPATARDYSGLIIRP